MSINNTPLASICIPVYNSEKYIRETLNDAISQTYKNLEIIISDDCSSDKSIEIIKSFNNPRIKIYSNPKNIGLVNNFTQALSYASGEYLMLLCADDGITIDAVEKGVKILESEEHKDVVIVNTYIQIIDDSRNPVFIKKYIFGGGKMSSYWGIRSNLLVGTNIIGEVNGSLFRKAAYDKITKPKIKNGNTWTVDMDLKFELLLMGKGYMIPEALGKFRLSNQSTSTKGLRFQQAKLFRQYVYKLYNDKRYNLSFFWVTTSTIHALLMQITRNIVYKLFL
jgi:glycosyltransferase involved in cell wall biosynthesis